jgi:hypothetical protein
MTTAGRSGRTSRDRGAVATEFGLLVTLVSILVTGGIAALLGQVWHFDPCEIFQVCSNDSGQSPPGASGDGAVGADGGTADPSTVPPSTLPTSVPTSPEPTPPDSVSPTDCPTPPASSPEPTATPQPASTDCAAWSDPSAP